jgi:heme exporter protein D
MFGLGPHAFFILASYAAVVLTLIGLIGWLSLQGRRLDARLVDLEARGYTRGSNFNADPPGTGPRS